MKSLSRSSVRTPIFLAGLLTGVNEAHSYLVLVSFWVASGNQPIRNEALSNDDRKMVVGIVVVVELIIVFRQWVFLDDLFEFFQHLAIQITSACLDAIGYKLWPSGDSQRSITALEVVFVPFIAGLACGRTDFVGGSAFKGNSGVAAAIWCAAESSAEERDSWRT